MLAMVFDVESIGLHGEGFAYGFVVLELEHGKPPRTLAEQLACCSPEAAEGSPENRAWIVENVPSMEPTHKTPSAVRESFWQEWRSWAERGAILVADCGWPVEARFLAACVDDAYRERDWQGPYPLHDLASVLLTLGRNPLAEQGREPAELPAHNPLNDARQTGRLLAGALAATREQR